MRLEGLGFAGDGEEVFEEMVAEHGGGLVEGGCFVIDWKFIM